jgi:hypothetical protein
MEKQMTNATPKSDIAHLNSFLRGEISAVETYSQAIEKLADEPSIHGKLADCRASHEQRARLLREEIARRGGEPAEGSGAWGSFAQLVEGGAKVFGKKAAIAALEEGEDHGRDDYRAELDELSPDVRRLVEAKLLPEQLRTHEVLSHLKHAM